MKLRILAVLLILISLGSSLQATDSLQTLILDWKVAQVSSPSQEKRLGQATDKLVFQADGSFLFSFEADSLLETGLWTRNQDTLVLAYELLAQDSPVDSVYYAVREGLASLHLFYQGKEVARQENGKLESERRVEAYLLEFDDRGNPTLRGENRNIQLYGRAELVAEEVGLVDLLRGLLGLAAMLAIAWLFSRNRKAIDWRLVGIGMGLQLGLAILVLKVPGVKEVFGVLADGFVALLGFTAAGSEFIFGGLVANTESFGYIFAFQILPTIVFFSALTAMLYYLGILQRVVYAFAWLMKKTMRLSGAESLAAAGNIFLGQTESPLLIRPYLDKMTRSEIMALMTGGMATIAGGVFAAYVGYLGGEDPESQREFAKHLLTASIMSAPAALVVAKMLVPETEKVNEDLSVPKDRTGSNLLDAISIGTTDGLKLAVNVGVMLLVFTALMEMFNVIVSGGIGEPTG
ncbi:MAG: Na+ dependent nucleoside transporter N-terminal domain-containing protein, partial [Bacteroidota bacterium]